MGWVGPLTHRQHITWLAWQGEDLTVPGKTELYLAQVACEVFKAPYRVWDGRYEGPALSAFLFRPKEVGQSPFPDQDKGNSLAAGKEMGQESTRPSQDQLGISQDRGYALTSSQEGLGGGGEIPAKDGFAAGFWEPRRLTAAQAAEGNVLISVVSRHGKLPSKQAEEGS